MEEWKAGHLHAFIRIMTQELLRTYCCTETNFTKKICRNALLANRLLHVISRKKCPIEFSNLPVARVAKTCVFREKCAVVVKVMVFLKKKISLKS